MKFTCLQSQRAHIGHNLLLIGDDRLRFLWLFFNRSKGKKKTDAFVIINSTNFDIELQFNQFNVYSTTL